VDALQTIATIAVFVSFPKSSFEVIKFGAGGLNWSRELSMLHSQSKQVEYVVVEEEEKEGRRVQVRLKPGLRSQVQGGYLSVAANVVGVMNDTIDFANKVRRKGKAIRGNDLDYPNAGANPVPTIEVGTVDIANGMSQMTMCRFLDIGPSRGDILTHLAVSTTADEMDLHALMARPTFYETFNWSATDASGVSIYHGDLTIAPGMLSAAVGTLFQPTLMEYSILPYNLWRATLVYTFEIIATQYHSGRLGFLTRIGSPDNSPDIGSAYDQYGNTMDIAGKNIKFEFRVKYEAATDMLRVPHEPGWGSNLEYLTYSMGTYGVYVLNPLQFGGVAEQIQINVYLSAEDVTYDMPGQGLTGIVVDNPYDGALRKGD